MRARLLSLFNLPKRIIYGLCLGLIFLNACGHSKISGTKIHNSRENREILAILEKLQRALVKRDADGVLALVSKQYFESLGNANYEDDYGYEELRDIYLPQSFATTSQLDLHIHVQDIVVDKNQQKAYADIRYYARAKLNLKSGAIWDSRKDFNRLEFVREGSEWKIVKGL